MATMPNPFAPPFLTVSPLLVGSACRAYRRSRPEGGEGAAPGLPALVPLTRGTGQERSQSGRCAGTSMPAMLMSSALALGTNGDFGRCATATMDASQVTSRKRATARRLQGRVR